MKNRILMLQLLAIIVLSITLFLGNANAEKVSASNFSTTSFQRILNEISTEFGVIIIADPSLDRPITSVKIQGDSAESTLKAFLEPLGYGYTKVDNYYLVCGPNSPLTVMAETESSLVPVGFLDPQVREKLGDIQQYFTYNEELGIAYVKAPSSQMNKVLTKLWKIAKTSGQISVAYHLQIIDLGSNSDLNFLFSKYDSTSAKKELIITPDQWSLESPAQILIQQLQLKTEALSNSITRQPWLITLPGKTVQLKTSLRYINHDLNIERYFTIQITPVRVDESNGRVFSDIMIARDVTNETKNSASQGIQTTDLVNKVSTTLRTTPGKRTIVAVVRQNNDLNLKKIAGLGKRKSLEYRDFVIVMTVTPVYIQSALVSSSGLIPIASLGGIDRLTEETTPQIKSRPFLEFGAANVKGSHNVTPWLDFSSPIGSRGNLMFDYRKDDLYSAGFSYDLDPTLETTLEFLAGKGIGPDDQNAFMIGLGDVTRPNQYVTLFAKYYPASYLLDTKKFSYDDIWSAGTRLGNAKAGVTIGASGNPGFEGWNLKFDYNAQKYTWILKVSTAEKDPTAYLGLGVRF